MHGSMHAWDRQGHEARGLFCLAGSLPSVRCMRAVLHGAADAVPPHWNLPGVAGTMTWTSAALDEARAMCNTAMASSVGRPAGNSVAQHIDD
jgi:hypothetical protein